MVANEAATEASLAAHRLMQPSVTTRTSLCSRRICLRHRASRLLLSAALPEGNKDGLFGEDEFEAEGLAQSARNFLDAAIMDYNSLLSKNNGLAVTTQ
ncbi:MULTISPECIES: hypothetical protein [Pseudomonas]|uniref:hypothetical protein n=1 Tax=Pseudomonas TaxID=286 RepID=UPI001585E31F|nr:MULTISPECIES: hypothetical protein [Pseudomonas]EKT4485448.1 hypothetical protein [Pseudomonas putida]UFH25180.1 hypothetical protein LMH93_16950 [Pseudomonas sp. CIP-10]WVM64951.1 hypothetical protein V1687_15675 [Pseudomonas putida]